MAGSANILRRFSEPNRTPRLLQDALVHPTRARSSVTGSKDERLQQTAAKPQGGCTRGPPPRGANPVGMPLISTRTRVKSAAAPVWPAVCKGRCRGASSARHRRARQCRVPDELELGELVGLTFSLSGTLHAWESTNALRAVIHGYAPRRKSRFRRNRETVNPGVEAAARSRRKIRRAARQHHTRSFSLLGSDDAVPSVDVAH